MPNRIEFVDYYCYCGHHTCGDVEIRQDCESGELQCLHCSKCRYPYAMRPANPDAVDNSVALSQLQTCVFCHEALELTEFASPTPTETSHEEELPVEEEVARVFQCAQCCGCVLWRAYLAWSHNTIRHLLAASRQHGLVDKLDEKVDEKMDDAVLLEDEHAEPGFVFVDWSHSAAHAATNATSNAASNQSSNTTATSTTSTATTISESQHVLKCMLFGIETGLDVAALLHAPLLKIGFSALSWYFSQHTSFSRRAIDEETYKGYLWHIFASLVRLETGHALLPTHLPVATR